VVDYWHNSIPLFASTLIINQQPLQPRLSGSQMDSHELDMDFIPDVTNMSHCCRLEMYPAKTCSVDDESLPAGSFQLLFLSFTLLIHFFSGFGNFISYLPATSKSPSRMSTERLYSFAAIS